MASMDLIPGKGWMKKIKVPVNKKDGPFSRARVLNFFYSARRAACVLAIIITVCWGLKVCTVPLWEYLANRSNSKREAAAYRIGDLQVLRDEFIAHVIQ